MPRHVFFSFHFAQDFWRTQQVRQINALSGQRIANSNDWEEIKRQGDSAIKSWIDGQMLGKSCVIVLVGKETALRPWVKYEIIKGWNEKKGILGIRIDKLEDTLGQQSSPGPNPFDSVHFENSSGTLSQYVDLWTPHGSDSKSAYGHISSNIEAWIEKAVRSRG